MALLTNKCRQVWTRVDVALLITYYYFCPRSLPMRFTAKGEKFRLSSEEKRSYVPKIFGEVD